jgi:hypothetical protein
MQEKDQDTTTENLVNNLREIIEDYKNLARLNVIDKASVGLSATIIGLVFLSFFSILFIFFGLAAAWWIGEVMENMKAGFFIVAAFFTLVITLLIVFTPKGLLPFIRNQLIKIMYDND